MMSHELLMNLRDALLLWGYYIGTCQYCSFLFVVCCSAFVVCDHCVCQCTINFLSYVILSCWCYKCCVQLASMLMTLRYLFQKCVMYRLWMNFQNIIQWSHTNKLQLNLVKTKEIVFRRLNMHFNILPVQLDNSERLECVKWTCLLFSVHDVVCILIVRSLRVTVTINSFLSYLILSYQIAEHNNE